MVETEWFAGRGADDARPEPRPAVLAWKLWALFAVLAIAVPLSCS